MLPDSLRVKVPVDSPRWPSVLLGEPSEYLRVQGYCRGTDRLRPSGWNGQGQLTSYFRGVRGGEVLEVAGGRTPQHMFAEVPAKNSEGVREAWGPSRTASRGEEVVYRGGEVEPSFCAF